MELCAKLGVYKCPPAHRVMVVDFHVLCWILKKLDIRVLYLTYSYSCVVLDIQRENCCGIRENLHRVLSVGRQE